MDNCWQRKCESMWQSTSSSSLQHSHSQFLNAGQNLYSCIPQDSVSLRNGMVQQSAPPWTSNSNVVNSSPAVCSVSFISSLSGPLPSLQGELQQSSNLESVFTLNEKLINRNKVNESSSGNRPVLVPASELSQYFSNHNFKAGETLTSTARLIPPFHYVGNEKLRHSSLPRGTTGQIPGNEMARLIAPFHYVGNEKLRHSSFPRGTTGQIPDSAVKFNDLPDTVTSKKVSPETESSGQLSSPLSSYPRVFCLGISGYLLPPDTGLLGVICLCHGSHMSVSRFCEHSGLSNVNPGNAVSMESGVTIAQWRKVFFQKLGVRVPEDHGGWDWPEVFPVGIGLGEFYPSLTNYSSTSEPFGAFGASGGAGQLWDNLSISKNPLTFQEDENVLVHNVKQTSDEGRKFTFSGSINTPKSRSLHVTNTEPTSWLNPQRLTSSKLDGIQGPEHGSSFISAYIGSNPKNANTSDSLPGLKISNSLGHNSLMQMDRSHASSNIELRLGHPSQQSENILTSAQKDFGCHPIVKPTGNQQSLFPELFANKVESWAMEGNKSDFHMFNFSPRSGKGQLDGVSSAYGVYNTNSESRARNSVFPVLQGHFNGHSEGILCSEATNTRVNEFYIPPEKPERESLTLKYDQIGFNCGRGNITNKEFNINTSCAHGHGSNDKGVGNDTVNLHSATELNFGLYSKDNENKRTVKRVVEGNGHNNCLSFHEKNRYSRKPYGVIMDMPDSDAWNTHNFYGNTSIISHNGPFDNGNVRSVCKPTSARAAPPTQAVPLGFSSSSSGLIRCQTLQSFSRESSNERQIELAENPRTQTLLHGTKFSVPPPFSSSATAATKEHVLCRSPFDIAPTDINQLYEPNVENIIDASKLAAVSAFSGVSDYMGQHYIGKHVQTLPPTDQLESCNTSALLHGGSLRPHDSQLHCQLSTDFNAVNWPYLRCGCSKSNVTTSAEQAKWFQVPSSFISSHCSCAGQPDTSIEHHFNGEPLHITHREQKGSSGCIKKNISAKLVDRQKIASTNVVFLDKSSDLMGHKINKMECHSSQWRDVPKKVTGVVSRTCTERTNFLNTNDKIRSADAGGNKPHCEIAFQDVEHPKEPELSYVSSGGSAHVITKASAVLHDKDLYGQSNVASNVVVDEGSGIDRCWSSTDAQGSEQSAEFFGVACNFDPMDVTPSKRFADSSSHCPFDELRLRDSLGSKNMQNQSSFSVQEKSQMADVSKKVIRKRAKWRKLDTTFPASAFYSACSYPGGTCGAGLQCSCKDKEDVSQSGNGSAEECGNSIEPSARARRFRMRSLRTLSCNKIANSDKAKTIGSQSNLLKVCDDDTFETCELSRKKKPKVDTASFVRQIDEGDNLCDEAAAKCSLAECTMSSGMHEKACRRGVRPIVRGKYGVISNGNPSTQVKFVSLKNICDSLSKCRSTRNCITKLTAVKYRKVTPKGKHRHINKSSNLKKVGISNACRVVTAKKSKSHLLTPSELDPCQSYEHSKRAHCHGGKKGDGVFYSLEKIRYDCLVKTGNSADGSLPTQQKPKSKDIQKQSLYELTLEGIHPGVEALTCARTEGYKGRKKEGVRYNFPQHSEPGGGCLVAQEQLNAWIHITGQKSSRKKILRHPPKDPEYDYRKEYARYKHSKGWKSLVVYKSGIHALGLYTSRFISQSEMVVEYVGEIVGLRVSDKREIEYLSGKKLQYKSACYFFKIDQEHIIDATQKGGIARFVNHSCQPNCVARIISVRNEKKVVFFAERDIYPGEEITYDYNFNHEDEGKKIPCFCNSTNCRQYLN